MTREYSVALAFRRGWDEFAGNVPARREQHKRGRFRAFRAVGQAGAKKPKGPATLSAEPHWITPGKIHFRVGAN